MKRTYLISTAVFIVILMLPLSLAKSGIGGAVRKVSSELFESFSKKFSKEVVEEGGEAAIKKGLTRTLSRYGSKYGDELVRVFKKLGPRSVKMVDSYGDDAIKIMSKWGDNGLRLLTRSADDVIPLFRRYGDEAIEVCLKHPGVGKTLISEVGEDGIVLGRKLSTDRIILILRARPELIRHGKFKTYIQLVSKHGENLFKFIENHKTLTLGIPAFLYLVNNPEVLNETIISTGKGVGSAIGEIIKHAGIIGGFVLMFAGSFWIFLRHKRKSAVK